VALVAVDVAAWLQAPLERRLARRFQAQAATKLARIRPTVVAITGSYGKTTVKNHVHDLLAGSFTTVASPASWNNQAGLSRAVNEHVAPDTEVFVAEMGTYGPGEIAAMVNWVHPQIAVIAAIGPVHLERMGTVENIAKAKAEILPGPRSPSSASTTRCSTRWPTSVTGTLWRVGTDPPAATSTCGSPPATTPAPPRRGDGPFDAVGETPRRRRQRADGRQLVVEVKGEELARIPAGSLQPATWPARWRRPGRGRRGQERGRALPRLGPPPNRAVLLTTEHGLTVIDDTFNSNPAGAAAAFASLQRLAPAGRQVVVTPGMVELGSDQFEANRTFAQAVRRRRRRPGGRGLDQPRRPGRGPPRAQLVPTVMRRACGCVPTWGRATPSCGRTTSRPLPLRRSPRSETLSTIAVVFGGLSPEHDISILTGLQAARLLGSAGHDVTCIYWTRAGEWQRVPSDLEGKHFTAPEVPGATPLAFRLPRGSPSASACATRRSRSTVAVNCCHGGPGEDGTLAGMLALAGIRVTGPGVEGSAWAMDKLATAGMVEIAQLDRFGIENIPTVAVDGDTTAIDLPTPWVVKPRYGGSSVGVEAGIEDVETAVALTRTGVNRAGAVAQVQLTGGPTSTSRCAPTRRSRQSAVEKPVTAAGGVYGYREKYLAGGDGMESAKRDLPADLPAGLLERIQGAAMALVQAIGLTGLPRVDFLYDGTDRLALCEINAIPGSLGLYLWAAAGHDRTRVVSDWVEEARNRPLARPHWSATTDGAALRARRHRGVQAPVARRRRPSRKGTRDLHARDRSRHTYSAAAVFSAGQRAGDLLVEPALDRGALGGVRGRVGRGPRGRRRAAAGRERPRAPLP
jgi:D-alanine--D-alanine ligase